MVSGSKSAFRDRRSAERGFTLIELIVSIAILAIISGAIAGVFTVGLRVLSPGGPTARLSGAHNLMVFEQSLGQDAARAACIQAGTAAGTAFGPYGSCADANGYAEVAGCSAAALCFGWPDVSDAGLSPAGPSCHVAVYTTSGSQPSLTVTRTEYRASPGAPLATIGTSPINRPDAGSPSTNTVNVQIGAPGTAAAPGGYTWVRSLPVTITATGVTSGQFSQLLELHPVATDPAGAAASITSAGAGGRPC